MRFSRFYFLVVFFPPLIAFFQLLSELNLRFRPLVSKIKQPIVFSWSGWVNIREKKDYINKYDSFNLYTVILSLYFIYSYSHIDFHYL